VYYVNNEFDIKIASWKSKFKDLALLSSQWKNNALAILTEENKNWKRKEEVCYLTSKGFLRFLPS
jgi:hypothetical protein